MTTGVVDFGGWSRIKVAVLLLLAAFTVVFSLFLNKPGHVTLDESVYQLMARSFAETGDFAVDTGYQEYPSPELSYPVTTARDGQLVPQYPSLYVVLAYPFYAVAGYDGLFFLNAIAFLGVLWLCYATAQVLFGDRALSLNACLILGLATYAWEYSQAVWPHALSMLFVLGAAYSAVLALKSPGGGRSLMFAAAAGLIAGLGSGVRVDVVFVLPALVVPFLFVSPWRPLLAVAVGLGTLPGLLINALINDAKFGIFSPFSYGPKPAGTATDPMTYLPLFLLGVGGMVALWALTRPRSRVLLSQNRATAAAVLAAVAVIVLLVPGVWDMVGRFAAGAYQLLVDLRVRDLAIVEGGQTRGPGGGVIYMGALKKSLLQSCPYLVMLILPFLALAKANKDSLSLGFLFLAPATFIGIYSFFSWHGGLSLNLRYFLPALPFTAILTAYGWRQLLGDAAPMSRRVGMSAAFAAAGVSLGLVLAFSRNFSIEVLETVLLTLPLVAASVLLTLLVFSWATSARLRVVSIRLAVVLSVACFAWAGSVALTYDFPRAWSKRYIGTVVTAEIAGHVPANAVILSPMRTLISGLYERGPVRLALPDRDEYKDFRPIIDFYVNQGRAVYVWLAPKEWAEVRASGVLDGVDLVTILEVAGIPFRQIVSPASRVKSGSASE